MTATTTQLADLLIALRDSTDHANKRGSFLLTASPTEVERWVTMLGGANHQLARATELVDRGALLLGSSICPGFVWIFPTAAEAPFRAVADRLGVELQETRDRSGNREFRWGPGRNNGMIGNYVG